ncbi:MAG: HAMP domain-containing sensor histidine kinase [Ignavibacteriales bacterium]|nr:HAMP domain-containing sensor histidine kinase [Ignavibacteriales bacterium]
MINHNRNLLPQSSELKVGLLILAFVIVAGTLWYTHSIVSDLEVNQKNIASLYAKSFEYMGSSTTQNGDYTFVVEEIVRNIDFPMILSDSSNEPIAPYPMYVRNIKLDSTISTDAQRSFLKDLIQEMDMHNPRIRVEAGENVILNYVHYGESKLITRLRLLPYVEFGVVAVFILIGYISFSYIKRSEQSSIWVGMARETAHQLGTPISSMMGWVELLRHQTGNGDETVVETLHDMDNDLQRLQKIASRFSRIGSKPDLKEENLVEIIEKVIQYFQRRIPQTGKKVQLTLEYKTPVQANVNGELFEWVIENLIKNALDAIENGAGRITISLSERPEHINIDVTDTGKGIDMTYRKEVFRPGFSTKKRGWGLGLSLAQRIIESYHRGKLILRDSKPGTGTTFRIKLRKR